MDKKEAWEHFLKTTVIPSRLDQVTALHTYYGQAIEEIAAEIAVQIDEVCQDAVKQQAAGKMQVCTMIRVSLLRTSLLEGVFEYMCEAVDEHSIPIFRITPFRYQATWIYKFYEAWNRNCEDQLRVYMGLLKPWFFENWRSSQLFSFHNYMVHAVRYAVPRIMVLPSFQSLQRGEGFEMVVGEYGDHTIGESVYYCNFIERSEKSIKAWLARELPHDYVHEHITKVDLSQMNYEGINLNYTWLQQVDLTDTYLARASLLGSRLDACEARNADFTGSAMFDADFTNSMLSGARFDEVIAPVNIVNEDDAVYFGLYPVKFTGADLTNASFRGAYIAGDFRGAILDGVDFQGADLTGSRMLKEDESKVHLSDEQYSSIIWS